MPPLPTSGSSYPPSSSGYQPLNRQDDDDLESSTSFPSPSFPIKTRSFSHSPYRSQANNPTNLLHSFLSDTRHQPHQSKQLSLRIRFHSLPSEPSVKTVELPLPKLSTHDSLPFALADDVPGLRGLPSNPNAQTWRATLLGLLNQLKGMSSTSQDAQTHLGDGAGGLQVWSSSQSKPLYATPEEVERYQKQIASGTVPPWASLQGEYLPSGAHDGTEEGEEEDVDKLLTGSGATGDFDLSTVFQRSRKRKPTRLVSVGLQEAFERVADDRHFSKRLLCRHAVWGWDMMQLKKSLRAIAAEACSNSKGKNKASGDDAEGEAIQVELDVLGLTPYPVYHIVWSPIPFFATRLPALFTSTSALIAISILSIALLVSVLLSILTNTLLILFGLITLLGWGTLMYLVRTIHTCAYDTIGTAWTLAPRWVKIVDADPNWDHDRVLDAVKSLGEDDTSKIESRGAQGWYIQRGVDQDEWMQQHHEQLLHFLVT